jgi:hypothetical protein
LQNTFVFYFVLVVALHVEEGVGKLGSRSKQSIPTWVQRKGWDAYETDGKKIKQIVLNDATIFAAVKPWFHKNEGGEKKSTTRFTHNTRVVLVSISRYLPRSGSVEVC